MPFLSWGIIPVYYKSKVKIGRNSLNDNAVMNGDVK
jgi:hypothetical protein